MSIEENQVNTEATESSQPAEASESNASTPDAESQPSTTTYSQEQVNETISGIVNQRMAPYENDLQLLNQLRNGGKEEAPRNLFDSDLGLSELPEATRSLHSSLQHLEAQNRELMAEKQERDYSTALKDFSDNLTGVLSDEKVLEAEMSAAIQNSPELTQMYTDAVQGKQALNANFLHSLKKEMAWRVVSGLNDPNSGILDSLVEKHSRKNALRDQSMISSNQELSGGSPTNDGFSAQVTYDR